MNFLSKNLFFAIFLLSASNSVVLNGAALIIEPQGSNAEAYDAEELAKDAENLQFEVLNLCNSIRLSASLHRDIINAATYKKMAKEGLEIITRLQFATELTTLHACEHDFIQLQKKLNATNMRAVAPGASATWSDRFMKALE